MRSWAAAAEAERQSHSPQKRLRTMKIETARVPSPFLVEYAAIPIAFEASTAISPCTIVAGFPSL